jgi:hypothetical protein
MAKQKNPESRAINKVFFILSTLATALLIILSSLAWWGGDFATDMVSSQLAAQKINFPDKGSPAFDPAKYPDLQQYAGQQVDTAEEAKAYANGYIARHIADASGGKTYSEVSTLARQNPDDEKLQELRMTVFMGESLRGVLLGTGYAFGTIGMIAKIAASILFALSAATAITAVVLFKNLRRS